MLTSMPEAKVISINPLHLKEKLTIEKLGI
jgi:hypothetical protein